MKSSWFKGKKQQKAAAPPPPVPAPKPTMSLSKQRRLAKRKKGLPKPKLATKQDDREIEGVIFIPHTADSSLRKLLQAEDDDITRVMKMGRTKYVEQAGVKFSSQLVRKNIWYSLGGGCGRPKCYPCKSSGGKGISCRQEGICYEMVCKLCEVSNRRTIYIGKSSRSSFERITQKLPMKIT